MNDLRFDLRPNVTSSGKGVVFIVDSFNEERPGFIMLDLGTGKSWRRLTQHPSTLRVYDNVGMYQNTVFYQKPPKGQLTHLPKGNDGATISADGEMMYYSPMTSDNLYSIPTKRLLDNSVPLAEQAASNAVSDLGQRGGLANGFESDSNGLIYMAMPESNAINIYDPKTLQTTTFVRDPRILWPDSMTVAEDGYLYVNINQRTVSTFRSSSRGFD
jgi:sugar lactone lactonase YvrE